MLEVLIHEKAHEVGGQNYLCASHGNNFYRIKKKGLRDGFLEYAQQNLIDPLEKVNKIVASTPKSIRLIDNIQLAYLIRKYKNFL